MEVLLERIESLSAVFTVLLVYGFFELSSDISLKKGRGSFGGVILVISVIVLVILSALTPSCKLQYKEGLLSQEEYKKCLKAEELAAEMDQQEPPIW